MCLSISLPITQTNTLTHKNTNPPRTLPPDTFNSLLRWLCFPQRPQLIQEEAEGGGAVSGEGTDSCCVQLPWIPLSEIVKMGGEIQDRMDSIIILKGLPLSQLPFIKC